MTSGRVEGRSKDGVVVRSELIERARAGDREAFRRLAEREVDRLLAVARLILRDSDLAEDAAQEALVRCWRQLPKLRDVSAFDGWLYRILVHAAADEAKRQRRYRAGIRIVEVEPALSDHAPGIVDRDQLERGFRRLSVDHRTVVVFHHYLGLSLSQIATNLGLPIGTVKSRYHYAMSALRAALEADSRAAAREESLA
jgi:RNA polymerase sigma-70 factor (ECF subfamily)